jgi:hypothetical protein
LVAVATFSSRRIHLIACSGNVVLQQLVRPSAGLDSPYGCLTAVDPKARCLIEVGPRCPFSRDLRRHRENGPEGPDSVRQPAGRCLSRSGPPQVSGCCRTKSSETGHRLAVSTPPLQLRRRRLMWFGGGWGIHRRESRLRVRRCLGDYCQYSALTVPVGSRQLRLARHSVECGLVGCSRAWWNDRENDHQSKLAWVQEGSGRRQPQGWLGWDEVRRSKQVTERGSA